LSRKQSPTALSRALRSWRAELCVPRCRAPADRRELVQLLGDGSYHLQIHTAGADHVGRLRFQALAGDPLPALSDVAGDVGHHWVAHPRGDVVPAHPSTPPMLGRVITIPAEIRQVDAADKRGLVVDHDRAAASSDSPRQGSRAAVLGMPRVASAPTR